MAAIAIDKLLQEVAVDPPCGPDLEYDPTFREMEQAAKFKPPPEFERGKPPEPPDWRTVQDRALDLLSRSKDVRTAIYLTRALLANQGLVGLSDGLALIRGLLENYWETLHPQLDPDDNDPTMRVNALLSLCDRESLINPIREAPLVSSRVLGQFNLRHIEFASGALKPPAGSEQPKVELASIDAAFMECDLEQLQATASAVNNAIRDSLAIETYVTAQVGAANAPNLSELAKVLKDIQALLSDKLARRGAITPQAAEPMPQNPEIPSKASLLKPATVALPGSITSRDDVIRLLDQLCEYYQRYEPSSPVPLLLQRAKRLASKSFLEVLQDIAPNGIAQAELIAGNESEPPANPAKKGG